MGFWSHTDILVWQIWECNTCCCCRLPPPGSLSWWRWAMLTQEWERLYRAAQMFSVNAVFLGLICASAFTVYFRLYFPRLKWTINMIFKTLPVSWHWPKRMPPLSPSLMQSMTSASRRSVTITKRTCECTYKCGTETIARWFCHHSVFKLLFIWKANINFWELENQHWLVNAWAGGHVRQVRGHKCRWDGGRENPVMSPCPFIALFTMLLQVQNVGGLLCWHLRGTGHLCCRGFAWQRWQGLHHRGTIGQDNEISRANLSLVMRVSY